MYSIVLPIIFSIILFPGILLVFVPFFPALSYMLVVALTFAILNGFVLLSPFNFGLLALITAISICVDWSAGALGARYGGAHAKSVWYGMLGMLLGTFFFPPFGGIIALFLTIFIAEKSVHNKTKGDSLKAASGALIGTIAGIGINAFLALIFFLSFVGFIFL